MLSDVKKRRSFLALIFATGGFRRLSFKRKTMTFGKKVTIYLADGKPSGIRHVEIANWSGQAIACPRSRLNELKNWSEAKRPGVYFLLEKQTAETGDAVYIGESENVLKRLSQQDKGQDFWNEVIIFTSKDENLTKGHIKYLESRITVITSHLKIIYVDA